MESSTTRAVRVILSPIRTLARLIECTQATARYPRECTDNSKVPSHAQVIARNHEFMFRKTGIVSRHCRFGTIQPWRFAEVRNSRTVGWGGARKFTFPADCVPRYPYL